MCMGGNFPLLPTLQREVMKMLAYKEKENDKPIKVSTNIKRRTKKVNNNRILGSVLIVLALLSLLLPETQEDGTAFIMMIILGSAAIFSK